MYNESQAILITGGAGFIGATLARRLAHHHPLIVLDLLTYAGDLSRLNGLIPERITWVKGDICDEALVREQLERHQPCAIIHCAAESHVDRSIDGPSAFLKTNVEGTMTLLRCATDYWRALDETAKSQFRFLHVSTDEVFGSLDWDEPAFHEESTYRPSSPYAASKAASDHFVRAWFQTYGLPTLITHCSNNYGPWQFPEKLIPLMISKCLSETPLPIYGDGSNIRDWIHVEDHVTALCEVLTHAQPGSSWGIGGEAELTNLTLVELICDILDILKPKHNGSSYREQMTFVQDRPGHDRRYAINNQKIENLLKWRPTIPISKGLRETVKWYLNAESWLVKVAERGSYTGQPRLGVRQS